MSAEKVTARLAGAWFSILVVGSAALVLVTFLSFALDLPPGLTKLLFWIGLAGENNVGAWWSGMLLLLASVLALDSFAAARARLQERRGWLALAAVLLILSFDEISSLHEYLTNKGLAYLALLAAPLFAMTCYSVVQLCRARVRVRTLAMLLLAFALLGTVPLQELVQQTREWPNPVIYGLRAALEEGVELAAILLLVAVTRSNTRTLLQLPGGAPFEIARHRGPLLGGAIALAPVLIGATFALPYPGGPADWLAAAAFFCCALLVARSILRSPASATPGVLMLLGWYVAASAGATAMKLEWDPIVLGRHIGVRGLFVALLLVSAVPVLRSAGRRPNLLLLGAAAFIAFGASLWPQQQILWCGLPILVALQLYARESGWAESRTAPSVPPRVMVPNPAAEG